MSGGSSAVGRLPALDAMRGLVMALMVVDHVDAVVNAHHASGDRAGIVGAPPLSAPDFLTRWCSHLCAPTFVFLAGASIALASARDRSPDAQRAYDRHLLWRGLVLLGIEFGLVSTMFRLHFMPGWTWLPLFAQVIYAIGVGMLTMACLRHLPAVVQAGLAVVLLVGCEMAVTVPDPNAPRGLLWLLSFQSGSWTGDGETWHAEVIYPALPWLPVMLLGHVAGLRVATRGLSPRRWSLAGAACLGVFAVLRGLDGFGNMALHRRDGSLLEWLHCSKYPPSVTFLAMELGLAALAIAGLAAWFAHPRSGPLARLLLLLGRVPMFFYLLHLALIGLLAIAGLLPRDGTWALSWGVAAALVVLCVPACAWYGAYRRRRGGWTRYL